MRLEIVNVGRNAKAGIAPYRLVIIGPWLVLARVRVPPFTIAASIFLPATIGAIMLLVATSGPTWPGAIVLLGMFVFFGFCVWCLSKNCD